jgi:hypothetical protein
VATLALLILATAPLAAGERVPLHAAPRPVLDAVRARFADARIAGVDREIHEGRVVYEVAIRHSGQRLDVVVAPDGDILLIKRAIAATDLPEPAARALQERYPGATYREVEEVVRVQGRQEAVAGYEVVLVTARRRTLEVKVGPDGRILK